MISFVLFFNFDMIIIIIVMTVTKPKILRRDGLLTLSYLCSMLFDTFLSFAFQFEYNVSY